MFRGQPVEVFEKLWLHFGINKLCFEQDCEPIFQERDTRIELFCSQTSIECVEKISHTLWNPREIIKTNGGVPPLTYQIFLHTVSIMGKPARPVEEPNFERVMFGNISIEVAAKLKLELFETVPTPEDFGVFYEGFAGETAQKWVGGERAALKSLAIRLEVEEEAFRNGYYLPNQANPDVLSKSTSLSAALRFGCVSVRLFYWKVHDLFNTVKKAMSSKFPEGPHITGQLIWREYFYTMAVENHAFGNMLGNPICLNIPWASGDTTVRMVEQWKAGQTGFPLIDAAMRQLLSEGWIHHTLRNIVSTFLTRGALWLSWEIGVEHFLKYLIDADWAVCAGNWMWGKLMMCQFCKNLQIAFLQFVFSFIFGF
jgi:cryptochrome